MERDPEKSWDLWTLRLNEERKPEPFLGTPFGESSAEISPDGRWVAYSSNESGKWEVYVRPFPDSGGKWQISVDGGGWVRWSPDGKELFYRRGDKLMVVPVSGEGASFAAERPRLLLEARSGGPGFLPPYDIAPDGQRFVWLKDHMPEETEQTHLSFVFNWFADLKARVPTGTSR